jgi:hypothetical protein
MITRENLIAKVAKAITDKSIAGNSSEDTAEIALDAIMAEVASPLCSAIESVSPFGKIIADQIRSIAGELG